MSTLILVRFLIIRSNIFLQILSQERNSLLEELLRKREDFGDISSDMQILEAERARLSLLEEKIKEVLVMLRALNSTVCEIRI